MNKDSRSKTIAVALATILPFCLYLLTLCRGIPVGDAPELALAAAKLQIAHPPGYPLLTNVGRLWSEAIFFLRPIIALNLLSAVFAAIVGGVFFRIMLRLIDRPSVKIHFIMLATVAALAASKTLWSTATNFEVYSLAALFTVLIIFLLVRFAQTGQRRDFYLAAYWFGLSLCNHLSLLALAPALLLAVINMRSVLRLRDILSALVLAIVPATIYGYLMIRSRFDLVMSWYNPQRWTGLKQQVFAETYQRFVASPNLADVLPYLHRLWGLFGSELVLPFLLLALGGLFVQWRKRRSVALMLGSIVLANCSLNFNYTISDIAPYYLPSIIVMLIWMFEFLAWVSTKSRLALLAVAGSIGIAALAVTGNYAESDLSERTKSELYALDLFDRTLTGAMLFCGSDNSMFPALYLRYVEDYRPDCEVYGHLPTLTRLQRDLGYQFDGAWTNFPDLLKHAIGSKRRPVVMVRELMNFDNNFPRILDNLTAKDLVSVVDSVVQIPSLQYRIDLESVPELYDPKEALMYTVYQLAAAESAQRRSDGDYHRYYNRAVKIVNDLHESSLSSALAAYFVDRGQHRLAIAVIESALELKTLRVSERLQLLGGLGLAQMRLQNPVAAKSAFEQMLDLDAANTEARFQLLALDASAFVQGGDLQAAITTYERMKQLAPEQHQVSMQLALLYLQTKDFQSARSALQRCVDAGYRGEETEALIEQLDSLGAKY